MLLPFELRRGDLTDWVETAQNIVVELQYRSTGKTNGGSARSCYLGWSGMPSRRKLAPVVGKDGISGGSSREELATVELDTTFGRLLGLAEGQRVCSAMRPSLNQPC